MRGDYTVGEDTRGEGGNTQREKIHKKKADFLIGNTLIEILFAFSGERPDGRYREYIKVGILYTMEGKYDSRHCKGTRYTIDER